MSNMQDTIAAAATALSDSGIGIIRISGSEAVSIADKIYRSKKGAFHLKDAKSHTIHYGFIVDGEETVDEVMVSVMKAPKSYTAEDTVEINCHGGVMLMDRVLKLVLRSGARMAKPGEFTKRAFLNGRIDLSRAEAVMDVIHSQSELSLRSSVSQLNGSVFEKIRGLREKIIYEIAFIEAALDDPEHISLDGYAEKLSGTVENVLADIKKLSATYDSGRIIKNGINTVIVGKPNAGKSSFLNLLLGEERAIVTEIAGTTRDILEENIRLDGISLNITDTAGIRSTEDVVEKIGVQKAKKYARDADLIVYVADGSLPLDENDRDIIGMIGDKKCIVLLNKADLKQVVTEKDIEDAFCRGALDESSKDGCPRIVKTCAKEMPDGIDAERSGLEAFKREVMDLFFAGGIFFENEVYITNMRHKEALMEAEKSLMMVKKSLLDKMPEDFYSIDLMAAYASLGSIVGESVEEDLVEEIFSKFCMGK